RIELEAVDAGGAVVARGFTAAVPLASFSEAIAVFMGPPGQFAAAPEPMFEPLDEVAVAPLAYGVLFAGGRDASGAPSASLWGYRLPTHPLPPGMDRPAARAGIAAAATSLNIIYLFGGTDASAQATAALWKLDANAEPNGTYTVLTASALLARTGASFAPLGS